MTNSPPPAPMTKAAPGSTITVAISRVRPERDSDIALPRYMTPQAAGADLCAAVAETLVIPPGTRVLVPTGFAIALPPGWEAQVRARSGLALRTGLTVLNGPGTIDADFRGEVAILVINHGRESVHIRRGERIAQLVVQPCYRALFQAADELPSSDRGIGGFGSTGD